jgi:small subunit ribosomal protein S6
MRFYECTVILCPELSKQQIEEVRNEINTIVSSFEGQTSKHEYWGLRVLAYPIEKFTRAHYIFFNLTLTPKGVIELERKMRIREDILRYLTIKVEEHDTDPTVMMNSKSRDESRNDDGKEASKENEKAA